MPPCWVSITERCTKRSPRTVYGFAADLVVDAGLPCESEAGPLGAELVGAAGEAGAPGAAPLFDFGGRPAACLHLSDSDSLCSLRQARIRPPPDCTFAQNFCASSAHALRIAAS